MSTSKPLRIGFLGPELLTNGYTAASRFAAHACGKMNALETDFKAVPFDTHPEIIAAHARGDIDFGVVAIENTLDGIIVESVKELERLFETSNQRRTFVVWEELLPIQHFLMSQSGTLIGVEEIHSHQSALRQCSKVLHRIQSHLGIELIPSKSTGFAVAVAAQEPNKAAIGPKEGLDVYPDRLKAVNLATLEAEHDLGLEQTERLSDFANGYTRFWIVGEQSQMKEMAPIQVDGSPKNLNRTCFLLSLPNETGTLHDALSVIRERGIFLSIIYPFPRVERDFEYMFFVEVEGHYHDAAVHEVMDTLNAKFPQRHDSPPSCVWLGSFPNTSWLKMNPSYLPEFRAAHYPSAMSWHD